MKVDLAMLLGMADRYGDAGTTMSGIDATGATVAVAGALTGSKTGPTAARGGPAADEAIADIGRRHTSLSDIAQTAADDYDSTDKANEDELTRAGLLK